MKAFVMIMALILSQALTANPMQQVDHTLQKAWHLNMPVDPTPPPFDHQSGGEAALSMPRVLPEVSLKATEHSNKPKERITSHTTQPPKKGGRMQW